MYGSWMKIWSSCGRTIGRLWINGDNKEEDGERHHVQNTCRLRPPYRLTKTQIRIRKPDYGDISSLRVGSVIRGLSYDTLSAHCSVPPSSFLVPGATTSTTSSVNIMKHVFAVSIVATMAASSVVALAARETNLKPWCLWRDQSCWKVKRVAEAFSLAVFNSGLKHEVRSTSSHQPGGAEYMAKRAIDALALAVAASQGDPTAYYNSLSLSDLFPDDVGFVPIGLKEGDPSTPAKPVKRLRSPGPEPWCLWRGQGCWKKQRSDSATEDSVSETDRRWCLGRGEGCWKAKRAAEAVLSAIGANTRRSPILDSAARLRRTPEPWCLWRGQGCWRNKRDVDDTALEARCNAPGGPCTIANNHLAAIQSTAQAIVDAYAVV